MMEKTNNEIEAKSTSFKEILDETDVTIMDTMNKLARIIECLTCPERSEAKPKPDDTCMMETLLRQHENAQILMKLVLKLENILF